MQLLRHHIIHGWHPSKDHLLDTLQAFWHFREELSLADGVLLKSNRAMLEKIHQSHRGTESCLSFAREAVFWPGMSKDVANACQSCPSRAKYSKQVPAEPMLSQPIPTRPWQFVSQDIFEYERNLYLVTVDHYSDFYELDKLQDTQSTTIVDLTKAHFARHGISMRCLTDNGPQFISAHYRNFAHKYRFQHVTSSPYWPHSNGKPEAAVADAKSALKKSDIYLTLLNRRNTAPRGYTSCTTTHGKTNPIHTAP